MYKMDPKTKVKQEPCLLEVLPEIKSETEVAYDANVHVKCELISTQSDPNMPEAFHEVYTKVEIKEEHLYLENASAESEETLLIDTDLNLDIEDNEPEEILPTESSRMDGKEECNYESGVASKSFDNGSIKLRENINGAHDALNTQDKLSYECNTCGKNFGRLSYMKKHSRLHETRPRPHKCEHCGKGFTCAYLLKRHSLVHQGKRPFKCDKCVKSFTQASHLKTHNLIHEGKRPFKCDKCFKTFLTASNLRAHYLSHEILFKCVICDKTFTQAASLKTHSLIHDGKRPFKCDKCDRSFIQAVHLKTHNLIVHECQRAFKCKICGQSFTHASYLKHHNLMHIP